MTLYYDKIHYIKIKHFHLNFLICIIYFNVCFSIHILVNEKKNKKDPITAAVMDLILKQSILGLVGHH